MEVTHRGALPRLDIVGLPTAAVAAFGTQVRSALRESGFEWPRGRVIITMAPTDLPKNAAGLHLPAALAILAATEQIRLPENVAAYGDLRLDGSVRAVRGTVAAACALPEGVRLLTATASAGVAAAVSGKHPIFGVSTLREAATGGALTDAVLPCLPIPLDLSPEEPVDFATVIGHTAARRALEIGAVGRFPVVLSGPAGAGRTMLARRAVGLLPSLLAAEGREILTRFDAAGFTLPEGEIPVHRPFRAPHHTVSGAGMFGNRDHLGELSLAHHGVLYLDAVHEFPRWIVESASNACLRGVQHLAGVGQTIPTDCWLIASTDSDKPVQGITQYLRVPVAPAPVEEVRRGGRGESTAAMQLRVVTAISRRNAREAVHGPDPADFTLRVARAIADLDGTEDVTPEALTEAQALVCGPVLTGGEVP